MKRFTQPGFDPCANCGERSHCEHITNPDFTILCGDAEMYKRLAAYEETGLEPQDILSATDMAKVACALHELNQYKELGDLDRLRELVEADRDGRCFTSPVKVGQTVWFVRDPKRHPENVVETTVEKIIHKHSGVYMKLGCNSMYETSCNSIGKTVFLTREAAEAALKGEQDGVH